MGNCLVTKLKGVVNNDNLLKVGEIEVNFSENFAKSIYLLGSSEGIEFDVRVIGEGNVQVSSSDPTSLGKEVHTHGTIWLSSAVTKIRISSKYDFVDTNLEGKVYCEDLSYCTNLKSVNLFALDRISYLPINMESITLRNTMADKFVDLDGLLNFPNLKVFYYAYPLLDNDIDIAGISPVMKRIEVYSAKWSSPTARPSTSQIFGLIGPGYDSLALADYLDNMLANMANCVMPNEAITINVRGTATANTVSLAQALKAHGGANLTLIVNDVTY